MFTVVKILELLPQDGSLEVRTLEKMLKLTKKVERLRLEIALKALIKLGVVEKDNQNYIQKPINSSAITATIRCSSKGYCFAIREDGQEDIYIRERFLNHSWHGDKVIVKINKEGLRRRSPEGVVLCVLERAKTNIIATLKEMNGKIIAQPLDERILSAIDINISNIDNFDNSDLDNIYDVRIKRYPIAQLPAIAEVSRKLSLKNGKLGDLEIIKTKYNILNNTSSPNVATKKINFKNRVNLENQRTLILRSWQCTESPILPAIYSENHEGGVKIWFHIPSVSERISFGSKLDQWIKNNSKSICFGDTWKNLLNDRLIVDSRFEVGKTNAATTLEIDIDKDGNCTNWQFYLSNIKPVALITSSHLEILKSRKPKSRVLPAKLKPIKDHINTIKDIIYITKIIKSKLISKGYLQLDLSLPKQGCYGDLNYASPGSDFDGWAENFNDEDPQSIIEVISKLSNLILAKHFQSFNLDFIALHKPKQESIPLNDIVKSAIVLEGNINLNEEGTINFNDLLIAASKSENKRLIEKLLKNSISDYKYDTFYNIKENNASNNNLLEAPWSSPGFNYADIINQFILFKLLTEGKVINSSKADNLQGKMLKEIEVKNSIFTKTQSSSIIKLLNESQVRELNNSRLKAKAFRDGLISMIQLRLVESQISKIASGIITGVQSYGFFVELNPSLAEGLVHVSSLDDDWYEYRSRQNLLIGRKNKRTFQVGDPVNVIIEKVDLLRNQIDLGIKLDNEKENEKIDTVEIPITTNN